MYTCVCVCVCTVFLYRYFCRKFSEKDLKFYSIGSYQVKVKFWLGPMSPRTLWHNLIP